MCVKTNSKNDCVCWKCRFSKNTPSLDILLNSTAHPPSTSKSTPPRCIFWTHRGCSTPRWPSSNWSRRKFNRHLEKNSIQPVFSTSPTQEKVKTAFEMLIQGYFPVLVCSRVEPSTPQHSYSTATAVDFRSLFLKYSTAVKKQLYSNTQHFTAIFGQK